MSALWVQRGSGGVEAVVDQSAAFGRVGFALSGVVVGARHAGVCELAVVVVLGQPQRPVVQLQGRLDETALRVGDCHVVHHLVVGCLVGQTIEDVHRLGKNVGGLRKLIRATVMIDEYTERVGQLGEVALRACLLRNDLRQRRGIGVTLDGQQAACLTDLQIELCLQAVGGRRRQCEKLSRSVEIAGLPRFNGALFQRYQRVGAAVCGCIGHIHQRGIGAYRLEPE